MTTFADLMRLAHRTLRRDEVELAGYISVLALESLDTNMDEDFVSDDTAEEMEQINEADKEKVQPNFLEALEEGDIDQNSADMGQMKQGDVPTAMVHELVTIAKQLRDGGHIPQAKRINEAIELLYPTPRS